MPAPFYIDTVWRMAVRYDFYEDYCDYIVGGYIDRFESADADAHKAYRACYIKYIQKK